MKLEYDHESTIGLVSLVDKIEPQSRLPSSGQQYNLLHMLAEVAAVPPTIPVNETCQPRPLPR